MKLISGGKGRGALTRKQARQVVAKCLRMNKAELVEAVKDDTVPAYEQLILRAVITAIQANDMGQLEGLVDQVVSIFGGDESDLEPQGASLALISGGDPTDDEPTLEGAPEEVLDLDKLRQDLASGIYFSSRMMARQVVFENKRISKTRSVLEIMEDRLFAPELLRNMPVSALTKLYAALGDNLSASMDYIKGFNQSVATSIAALTHVQNLTDKDDGSPNDTLKDKAVAAIRAKIQEEIRKKLAQ